MPLSGEQKETRRTKARRIMDLKCLTCLRDGFYEAVIMNISEDGLYLECDHEMRPGENIRIHLLQRAPAGFCPGELNESTGTVRWCRPLAEARHRRYGAGVRFS
ncbi:MAG: PilZ domain protein [Deltaproteobacteria bacterium ADurb.BinA179]|jgi:Tfp pilus assembly protein PilZ|nr:MAG: PilZ domain protein [Deltaproteobacteria bacterium ADurb.BinA179]HNU73341.1 PilZ domain-containing protein [Deltaproteobacteria bacterium]HOD71147.1 PilZ domain-containing protein [Deltaproteobacteria bacterium]HOE72808.1 PilZ domain-containing protein [Deltaproteobacteria bacterium]HON61283.1 PilZ domain-containing protein [Deltaproteobacteria bacterium]